jgi:predicted nucleic-acid-binding Zn-ribbon protein
MSLKLRCHRCRSADLALNEIIYEHARYDEGLYLDADGAIRAHGHATFSSGEIQPRLTEIECLNCGHSWHPRRNFAGNENGSLS